MITKKGMLRAAFHIAELLSLLGSALIAISLLFLWIEPQGMLLETRLEYTLLWSTLLVKGCLCIGIVAALHIYVGVPAVAGAAGPP